MNLQLNGALKLLPFILTGLFLVSCGDNTETKKQANVVRPVKTITVKSQNLGLKRTYPATVLPSQKVDLSFRVSGRIIKLPIKASQQVKKGDVIAQLDPRDFKADVSRIESQLSQAKAQLRSMTSGAREEDIASLKAKIDAANVKVKAAKDQLARSQALFEKGIVTKAKLDEHRTSLSVAEAELKTANQELIKGQSGSTKDEVAAQRAVIKGLETQLQTAKDNLSDSTLRAPFDGIIAKREVENFANVQAKENIATLQYLAVLEVIFDVPGSDVTELAANEKNIVSAVKLNNVPDREFSAKFVEFSTEADPATQTYRGRVSITPPKGIAILPGMTGSVIIKGKASGSSIAIPLTAISSDPDGKSFVWVIKLPESKVQKRSIKTGKAFGSKVTVLSGLHAGDKIVTAGVSQLQPGMVVRAISKVGD